MNVQRNTVLNDWNTIALKERLAHTVFVLGTIIKMSRHSSSSDTVSDDTAQLCSLDNITGNANII